MTTQPKLPYHLAGSESARLLGKEVPEHSQSLIFCWSSLGSNLPPVRTLGELQAPKAPSFATFFDDTSNVPGALSFRRVGSALKVLHCYE